MKVWVGPVVLGVGVVILVATVVLGWVVIPNIIDDKIVEEVRLVPGTDTWEKWQEIPVPIYLKFYVYNITNPDDVEAGLKPIFTEKGPYSYREHRIKVNISQESPEVVSYTQLITYFYDKENSCNDCLETDKFNIINIAFLSVVMVVRESIPVLGPLLAAAIANILLSSETLVRRNVRVGDLTFKGFDTSLYTRMLGGLLPSEFDGGRFGLYKGQNGTVPPEDHYTIYTGVGKTADFGRVKTWNDSESLSDEWWGDSTSYCSMVNGTDGSLFPPFVEKDWVMYVFSTDLCRSLYLTYEKEVEHRGIKGYRFVAPRRMLEDPRKNEENQCFCLEDNVEDCTYAGVIHIKGCKSGAPIIMSTPRFLDGDERYLKASGLPDPVKSIHETVIDIEPNTGLTLAANKRIQVNVEVLPIRSINALKNISQESIDRQEFPTIFPLLWADEEARLDQENADDLKSQLLTPLKIIGIVKWVLMGVGLVVIGVGAGIFVMQRRKARQTV